MVIFMTPDGIQHFLNFIEGQISAIQAEMRDLDARQKHIDDKRLKLQTDLDNHLSAKIRYSQKRA